MYRLHFDSFVFSKGLPLKIGLVGSSGHDALESNMKDVLTKMGHQVEIIEYLPISPILRAKVSSRVLKILVKIRYIQNLNEKRIVNSVLRTNCDLVLVFTYAANFISCESIRKLRDSGIYTCSWFVDASVNFLPGRFVLAEYNRIYVADYGLFSAIKDYCQAPINYLPEGHHPDRHKIPSESTPNSQIAIVGTLYTTRIMQINRLMKFGYQFDLYGGSRGERLANGLAHVGDSNPKVFYEEKSKVFFDALCVLNFPHASAWNSINCRVFEVLASGGILVTPRSEAILNLVQDRKHAFLYGDFDELLEILDLIRSGRFNRRRMIEDAKELSTANSLDFRARTILEGYRETTNRYL